MNVETIKEAVEYKQGHFNMVQYILKTKTRMDYKCL